MCVVCFGVLFGRDVCGLTPYMFVCVCVYAFLCVWLDFCVVCFVCGVFWGPPDTINHFCSLTGVCISRKYFTNRSARIFKILFQGF